jgi:hypothetical protein
MPQKRYVKPGKYVLLTKGPSAKMTKMSCAWRTIHFNKVLNKLLAHPFNSITELPRVLTFVSTLT